jgi:hypothetical protein
VSPEPHSPDEARSPQAEVDRLTEELRQTSAELAKWRERALDGWDDRAVQESLGLRRELDAMRRSVSWRVTRPLRVVRTRAAARRSAS